MKVPTKSKLYAVIDRLQGEVAAERESTLQWAHAAGRAAERQRKDRARFTRLIRELRAQVRALSLALPNGTTVVVPAQEEGVPIGEVDELLAAGFDPYGSRE